MRDMIDVFSKLGDRLSAIPSDVIARAIESNPWFSEEEVRGSIEAICSKMLNRVELERWMGNYAIALHSVHRVGIVMAGNIPLVGFFDLLCVLITGNCAAVKISSKDKVLMKFVIGELRSISPEIGIVTLDDSVKLDAVIATGSDNTNRYFRAKYESMPSILRHNRYSVAVLSGEESDQRLSMLAKDIFMYSGLGCRSVSRIMVPEGYNVGVLCEILSKWSGFNSRYVSNYSQCRALNIMQSREFLDGGAFTMVNSDSESQYLSEISYFFYSNIGVVERWIDVNIGQLQCVVSDFIDRSIVVSIGEAQSPGLMDYPDGVDVVEFLMDL